MRVLISTRWRVLIRLRFCNCSSSGKNSSGGGEADRSRPDQLFEQHFWQQGISPVAGVDEAGVGAWAGPAFAAAVILPRTFPLAGLNDSKLLSARCRAALFNAIGECAVAVGGRAGGGPGDRSPEYLLGSNAGA